MNVSDRRGEAARQNVPVELVLFDLGGVLIDFRGPTVLRELIGAASVDEVWLRWLRSPWARRFDAGLCSAQEFAAGMTAEWQLPYAPAEFLTAFESWVTGPLDGADALLDRTRARVPIGFLSNMNALHWELIRGWAMFEHFNPCFVSYQLGLVKPDQELFEHVVREISLDPARVLFLDDNPVNVEQAVASGFQAAVTRGVSEAERALVERGVLG